MKIDFSNMFNITNTNKASTAGNLAGALDALKMNSAQSVKKPLNMDTVSFSEAITKELKKSVEDIRPPKTMLAEDQKDKASGIKASERKFNVSGKEAAALNAARDGAEDAMGALNSINDKVGMVNSEDLTGRDRAEIQNEIERLKEQMNRTAKEVSEYSGYGALINTTALGIDDLSVLTEESALEAVKFLDKAMLRLKKVEKSILEELEALEEGKYKDKLNSVITEINELEALKQSELDKLAGEAESSGLTVEDAVEISPVERNLITGGTETYDPKNA